LKNIIEILIDNRIFTKKQCLGSSKVIIESIESLTLKVLEINNIKNKKGV